jgi:hypothetical protein
LRKEIKEGVVGRGRPGKSAETRDEALRFKEEIRNECVLVAGRWLVGL